VTVPFRESFPEIRIVPAPERGLLLYDGECGFCSRSVRLLERFARRPFEKRPSREVLATLPEEVARTVSGQMLWLESDGTIWGGSHALLCALRATGWSWLAFLLGNPIVRPFTRVGYRSVARLRHRFGAPVCELPPRASK
jgi:predicted DCC family thiol-disulfide oxidoreductase YuxK